MKGIVLFISKHGSTRQYAEWISEETGFPMIDLKKNKRPDLEGVDIIIIGSWILAGKMVARGWIRKNWPKVQDKKVIVFSVGGDVPNDELREKCKEASLPEDMRDGVSFYRFQGRFRQEDQNFFLRGMLKFAAKYEKEGDLAQNMVIGVDGVKRENLDEMLRYIASLSK